MRVSTRWRCGHVVSTAPSVGSRPQNPRSARRRRHTRASARAGPAGGPLRAARGGRGARHSPPFPASRVTPPAAPSPRTTRRAGGCGRTKIALGRWTPKGLTHEEGGGAQHAVRQVRGWRLSPRADNLATVHAQRKLRGFDGSAAILQLQFTQRNGDSCMPCAPYRLGAGVQCTAAILAS